MECKICFEKFNKTTRKPQVINCGHSMCSDCISNIYDYKHLCPTCRKPITDVRQNHALFELLDVNLIVHPNYELINSINNEINALQEMKKNILIECSKKKNEINKNMLRVKEDIEIRANKFVDQIISQQDMLEKESENICKDLSEKINTISKENLISLIDIEKMEKSQLLNFKQELKEAKQKIEADKLIFNQISTHFFLEADQKQNSIGRICLIKK